MSNNSATTVHNTVLDIVGMSCASCAAGIEKALAQLEGITQARVNFASEKAMVSFDVRRISLARIAGAIRKLKG